MRVIDALMKGSGILDLRDVDLLHHVEGGRLVALFHDQVCEHEAHLFVRRILVRRDAHVLDRLGKVVLPGIGLGDVRVQLVHFRVLREQVFEELPRLGELLTAQKGHPFLGLRGQLGAWVDLLGVLRQLDGDVPHPAVLVHGDLAVLGIEAVLAELEVPFAAGDAVDRPLTLLVRLRLHGQRLASHGRLHLHVLKRLALVVDDLAGDATLTPRLRQGARRGQCEQKQERYLSQCPHDLPIDGNALTIAVTGQAASDRRGIPCRVQHCHNHALLPQHLLRIRQV